jgi:hypothetical protein
VGARDGLPEDQGYKISDDFVACAREQQPDSI